MKNYYNDFQKEKKTYFRDDIQKERDKEKRLRNFRLWNQQNNLKGKDIIINIRNDKNFIKQENAILNEDDLKPSKQSMKFQRKKNEKKNGIIPNDSEISEKCRTILNSIYQKINNMKNETQQLIRKNGLSLQKTQNEFYRGRPNTSHYIEKLPAIEDIKSFYNQNSNDKRKQIKRPINFIRINDNFRKDLNRAFKTFNPLINLQNLNELKKYDINVKEDIDNIREKIDNEIQQKNDGNFYKKRYEKIHNKFMKTTSNFSTNNNANKSTMGRTKSTNFNSLNNTKTNFKPKKDKKEKEYDIMEDALESLYNTLEIEPIIKYIDENKNNKNYDKKDFQERKKNYFPELNNTEKALQKIIMNRISAENEKNTEQINKFADNQQFNLLKNLEDSKEKLMEEVFKKNNVQ
jgi:hypothetical protein